MRQLGGRPPIRTCFEQAGLDNHKATSLAGYSMRRIRLNDEHPRERPNNGGAHDRSSDQEMSSGGRGLDIRFPPPAAAGGGMGVLLRPRWGGQVANSLWHTFTFGTSEWPAPFTPEGVLVYELPDRQRRLELIAKRQLEAIELTRRDVVGSQLAAADVIVASMDLQCRTLQSAVAQAASDITESVAKVGEDIAGAVDEIRWELVQLGRTTDAILEVLRNSRSNEAQQPRIV